MGLQKILYVGVGGFLGAALRYVVSLASARAFGTEFPYGTLVVNAAGGLLIGVIMQFSFTTDLVPPNLRLFLVTGVLGGLTTFSTFTTPSSRRSRSTGSRVPRRCAASRASERTAGCTRRASRCCRRICPSSSR